MAVIDEGVIKFHAEHRKQSLSGEFLGETLGELCAWRNRLADLGLVGQSENRYGGAGYGNLSARVTGVGTETHFLITGTKTGKEKTLSSEHFCMVTHWDLATNQVRSSGPLLPSSESLTHAAIYDLSEDIHFVFHAHSPEIWNANEKLRLPQTDRTSSYGTVEMAREVSDLYRSSDLPSRRVLVMRGHEDGVIAFGLTAEDAGKALLNQLARA